MSEQNLCTQYERWLEQLAKAIEKEDGTCRWSTPGYLMDRCRTETPFGAKWDLEKVRMTYDVLNRMYPNNEDIENYHPDLFFQRKATFDKKIAEFRCLIENAPLVTSFSAQVTYGLFKDSDETEFKHGYPEEALREIEFDYLMLNDEKHLIGDWLIKGRRQYLPLWTWLKFNEDGSQASFLFTARPEYCEKDKANLIQEAREWLEGQLSDGFGEDFTRYERVAGPDILVPYFGKLCQ